MTNPKALVLFSGGVDSTTCLAIAISRYGADNVTALSVSYGQKHKKETEAAEKIADYYKVRLIKLDLAEMFRYSTCSLLENRAGIVKLTYTAEFTLNAVCDRCLTELHKNFSLDFTHILVDNLNSEDDGDEYVLTEGDSLDMDKLAVDDILLQMPSRILCKEDCKGLCHKCGTNLNINNCNCNG